MSRPLAPLPAAPSGPRHVPVFDSLRGYAICGVLIVHCALPLMSFLKPEMARDVQFGQFGVQLFYMVSACTLFWSLHSRTSADRRPLCAFFLRRFFRIAPAFWVAIAASLWVNGLSARYNAPAGLSAFDILSTLFFVHGIYPTSINSVVGGGWSVAVEMPFYLLVPLCFHYIRTLSHAIRFVVATYFLGLAANWIYTRAFHSHFPGSQQYLLDQFLTLWLPVQLPVFGMGFILFFLVRDRLTNPAAPPSQLPTTLRTKPDYLLIWALVIWGAWSFYSVYYVVIPALLSVALVEMLFAWMLTWWPIPLLVNRFIGYIGKISYSMYLSHFLLLALVGSPVVRATAKLKPEFRYLLLFATIFPVTVLVSTITYFLIEKPFIACGKIALARLQWGPVPKSSASQKLPPAATAPL